MPTTSGSNRSRHAAATACRPGQRVRDADHRDVRRQRLVGRQLRDEHGRGPGRGRRREVAMAVGPLAGERHEQVARLDEPRIHGAAADRSRAVDEEVAAA